MKIYITMSTLKNGIYSAVSKSQTSDYEKQEAGSDNVECEMNTKVSDIC